MLRRSGFPRQQPQRYQQLDTIQIALPVQLLLHNGGSFKLLLEILAEIQTVPRAYGDVALILYNRFETVV